MKKLYLLRHAKSSWINPFIKDFERPLNKKGLKKINNVYDYFIKKNINIDKILSSSAKRALETANIFKKNSNIKNIEETEELYNAQASKIENIILETDDSINSLMIVGHNPGLNLFAYELLDFSKNIETSSFLEIDLNIDSWRDLSKKVATLVEFYTPD